MRKSDLETGRAFGSSFILAFAMTVLWAPPYLKIRHQGRTAAAALPVAVRIVIDFWLNSLQLIARGISL